MKKKHLAPLDLVHKLSMAIADAVELEEVYQLVLDQVVELLGVDKASIMIFDENMGALKIVAAHGMDEKVMKKSFVRVGEGISGKVFASHEPLLITDVKTESLGSNRDRYKTNSLMSSPVTCVPMKMGVENLGVINVTDRSDGTAFTDDDLTLLTTISNQAASYLHVCRLSEKLRGSEKLEHQLEIARQIQFRLIPTLPPQIAGLDVAGRLNTADRVGGDYYDCFLAREKRPAFVIADVSGHSIGAAIIMAAFRSSVRAQQDSDYLPSTLVQRVNQILFEDLYQSEQFISMVYLQYLESRQLIQFTNAGHPPPLMWRGKERRFEWLSTEDSLLGIDSKFQFHEKK
ncbi:MAG: hypothetical protein COX62_03540, partial [Deltaproteobacteria bacterium CG_4_10_14_0_2_um_filter_43_8]